MSEASLPAQRSVERKLWTQEGNGNVWAGGASPAQGIFGCRGQRADSEEKPLRAATRPLAATGTNQAALAREEEGRRQEPGSRLGIEAGTSCWSEARLKTKGSGLIK